MTVPATIREYRTQGASHHELAIQNAPLPKLKANEVTIKVHAVSLQYRDLIMANVKYPGLRENIVPCSDAAGEIVAMGEDVAGWNVGDRVSPNFSLDHIYGDVTEAIKKTSLGGDVDGVLREYINVPAHSLVKIPDYLTYEEGSTLPFAARIALASGAIVILTSSSDAKLEIAKNLGVQHLINYKTSPDWEDKVLEITGGRGVDHILEVGGSNTVQKSIKAVRYAGHIHIIGVVAGGDSGIPFLAAISKAITFRGLLVGSVKQFEDMNRLFTARHIRPVVDRVFSFEEAAEAYSHLASQKHVGKVVIKVTKE